MQFRASCWSWSVVNAHHIFRRAAHPCDVTNLGGTESNSANKESPFEVERKNTSFWKNSNGWRRLIGLRASRKRSYCKVIAFVNWPKAFRVFSMFFASNIVYSRNTNPAFPRWQCNAYNFIRSQMVVSSGGWLKDPKGWPVCVWHCCSPELF